MTADDDIDKLDRILDRARAGEDVSEALRDLPDEWRERAQRMIDHDRALFGGREQAITDLVGERIGGYVIREIIGRGGQGTVYRGWDERLDREVAVKVTPAGGGAAARLRREGSALARLRHGNLCAVYDVGEHRNAAYIVMEFVDGESLQTQLHRDDAPPPLADGTAERERCERALRIVLKVARAIAVAHAEGLLHRDLKPANIMMRSGDEPVVLDFGLASIVADEGESIAPLTMTGEAVGTPAFMAPEQIQCQELDVRVDVYALGVMLFEMLTRTRAFAGPSRFDVYSSILAAPALDVRRVPSWLSEDVRVVVATAMARDLELRYRDMGAFADDLERILQGQPVHARPLPRLARAWRWAHREPLKCSLLLAAACLLGLLTFVVVEWDQFASNQAEIRRQDENERATRLTERAYVLLQRGDPDARVWFEQALQLAPDSVLATAGKAMTEADDEASLQGLGASEQETDFVLGCRAALAWRAGRDPSQLVEAKKRLVRAMRYPATASSVFHDGLLLLAATCGDRELLDEAAAAIEQAWPDRLAAWTLLASAFFDHDREQALRYARRAVQLDSSNHEAAAYLGRALSLAGNDEDAVRELQRSLDIEESQLASSFLFWHYRDRSQWELAEQVRARGNVHAPPAIDGHRFARAELSAKESPRVRDEVAIALAPHQAEPSAIMFGGRRGKSTLNGFWRFDGREWRSLLGTGRLPPKRSHAAMVFDPIRRSMLLFGGVGSTGDLLGDTWHWTGSDDLGWVGPRGNGPAARRGHSLTTNWEAPGVLLFGGRLSDGACGNDTWRWDGKSWTQIATELAPPAREAHAAAWLPVRGSLAVRSGLLAIFGGYDVETFGDMWLFDGERWRQHVSDPTPPARRHASMAWDALHQRLLLYGGRGPDGELHDLWAFDPVADGGRGGWALLARELAMPSGTRLIGWHVGGVEAIGKHPVIGVGSGDDVLQAWRFEPR